MGPQFASIAKQDAEANVSVHQQRYPRFWFGCQVAIVDDRYCGPKVAVKFLNARAVAGRDDNVGLGDDPEVDFVVQVEEALVVVFVRISSNSRHQVP